MKSYIDLGLKIINNGERMNTRNGIRWSLLGETFRHDLRNGFPLLTTRYVPFENIFSELCWFILGRTDVEYLHEHDNHIWDANATKINIKGKEKLLVGPIYGAQWRDFGYDMFNNEYGYDQLAESIRKLKSDPYSTQNIVSAWNPKDLVDMVLPPCHFAFQVHCIEPNYISLQVYQRSCDWALGAAFNIPSYSALLHCLALISGRTAKEVIFSYGNVHIYEEHVSKFIKQSKRSTFPLPTLFLNDSIKDPDYFLDEIKPSDFELWNYTYHDYIKYNMIP